MAQQEITAETREDGTAPVVRKNPVVLIVGDSFIDENWLMSRVDIYHSYNVGDRHYISDLPNADGRIISFCGAAGLYRMLQGPQSSDQARLMGEDFDLFAISAWSPRDTGLLKCLLCNKQDALKGLTPYRVSGLAAPQDDHATGRPRCPVTNEDCTYTSSTLNLVKQGDPDAEQRTSSNRLIRLYEGFGSDQPHLRYRFDWRLELKEEDKDYQVLDGDTDKLDPKAVQAIVVLDHGYGVINPRLVRELQEKFPEAKWYVRCKLEFADWMKELAITKQQLRLVFTDEQLLEYRYGVRAWEHGPKVLGRGALEVLGDLLGLQKCIDGVWKNTENPLRADHAALLFHRDTAIAASRPDGDGENNAALINLPKSPGEKQPIQVGRSTAFFASLVYGISC